MTGILKKFWKSKTYRDFYIVLADRVLSRGVNLVLFLLIARTLGPEKYGIYSLITVSIIFLVVVFDIGGENIAIRFSGKYQDRRETLFGLYVSGKTAIVILLFILIALFPNSIVKLINKPEAQHYLFIIFIGFVIDSYRFILATYYQSLEKFIVMTLINVGSFLLRLTVIFILLQLSYNNIETISIYFAISGLPIIIIFAKKYYIFVRSLIVSGIDKPLMKEIYDYGKWVVLAALPTSLMMKLDFYVVTSFASFEDMGLYNSAVQLVSFFAYIPGVFGTVLLPKAAKCQDNASMRLFVKKSLLAGLPITLFALGIIPFSRYIIPLFLGEKFIGSIPYFQVLIFGFIFVLWTSNLVTVFCALGKTMYVTSGAYIQLIIFIAGSIIFGPHFGIAGIVWSKVFANAAYLIWIIYSLFFNIRLFSQKAIN